MAFVCFLVQQYQQSIVHAGQTPNGDNEIRRRIIWRKNVEEENEFPKRNCIRHMRKNGCNLNLMVVKIYCIFKLMLLTDLIRSPQLQ